MLIELMLINMGILFLIFVILMFVLVSKPSKKSSFKKVKSDLKEIKKQINGEK